MVRDDSQLLAAAGDGDEAAFAELVERLDPMLVRVARAYVPTAAVAEEVVQEAWISVVRNADSFEGRSSARSWITRIVINAALRTGERERRTVPFSALAGEAGEGEPAVDPSRFLPDDHDRWPGHWSLAPAPWPTPEEGLLAGEVRGVVVDAIDALPRAQRLVIGLRDIAGWPADEVAELLEISPGNQRVLLHRARSKVRGVVEDYLGATQDLSAPAGVTEGVSGESLT